MTAGSEAVSPNRDEWTQMVVRHPHGLTSRLWVSADGSRYKVFEHGPSHPMNRLIVDEDASEGVA